MKPKLHGIIMIIQTYLMENKAGGGKSTVQKYNIKVIGLNKFRTKFVTLLIHELDKTRTPVNKKDLDDLIPTIETKVDSSSLTLLRKRSLNSVYTNGDIKEQIVSHLDNWTKSKDLYYNNSITYMFA